MLITFPRENKNALPGRASPEKASDRVVRRRLCLRWARSYAYPGSILATPSVLSLVLRRQGGGLKLGTFFQRECDSSSLGTCAVTLKRSVFISKVIGDVMRMTLSHVMDVQLDNVSVY